MRSQLSVIKGAPEAILGDGRLISGAGASTALEQAQTLAEAGQRVLALADQLDSGPVRYLGLIALHDPPREQAAGVIASCQRAGVQTVLITGDHLATATAVARFAGIDDGAVDLTGLDRTGIAERVRSPVFARATPEQKLQAVQLWQARGRWSP